MNEHLPSPDQEQIPNDTIDIRDLREYLDGIQAATRELSNVDGRAAADMLRSNYVQPLTQAEWQKHEDLHSSSRELGYASTSAARVLTDLERQHTQVGPEELRKLAATYAGRAEMAQRTGDISGIDGYEALAAAAEFAQSLADHYEEVVDTVAKSKYQAESSIDVAA